MTEQYFSIRTRKNKFGDYFLDIVCWGDDAPPLYNTICYPTEDKLDKAIIHIAQDCRESGLEQQPWTE